MNLKIKELMEMILYLV